MSATNQRKSAPFSTHARGVPLFDKARFSDVPHHAARSLLHLRDMSSSSFWFLSMQSWSTFWSVIVTMFSVVFYSYYSAPYDLAASLDWGIVGFIIILPLVIFLFVAYQRRERCLGYCAEAKTLMLSIITAAQLWLDPSTTTSSNSQNGGGGDKEGHVADVCGALGAMCTAMHDYFMPSRFYARSYPYFGYKTAMIQIALDRSRHQKDIRVCLQHLTASVVTLRSDGLPPTLEAALHGQVYSLQLAIEHMSNVKEYRTPQGIRSMCRWYVCLIVPLFYGPYWAFIGSQTNFAFTFFLAIVWQIALCGLLNVYIDLEDPFDNYGLDGIFIDEYLYDVQQCIAIAAPSVGAELGFGTNTSNGANATNAIGTNSGGENGVRSGGGGGMSSGGGGGTRLPAKFDYEVGSPPRVVRVDTDTV